MEIFELVYRCLLSAVGTKSQVTYDPELEKLRFQFEMRKYEEEKAERLKREEKAERLRLEAKEEAERLRLKDHCEWQKTQAAEAKKLQDDQFKWQQAKDEREKAKQESVAAQLKLYGDIVKNVAPKFPSDYADIPIFF